MQVEEIQSKVLQQFKKKLDDALRVEDDMAYNEGRAAWNDIDDGPSCPSVKVVMQIIKRALGRGHVARETATLQLVKETADSYGKVLSPNFINELMEVIVKAFPQTHYVGFAKNTRRIYTIKAPAQRNKFNEKEFNIELACVQAASSSMANQTISRARMLLDEYLIKEYYMDEITNKKAERFKFLQCLYEKVKCSAREIIDGHMLAEELGFSREEADNVLRYLASERLIDRSMRNAITITHQGIVEVEEALSKPKEPTQHFPAIFNILNVDKMVGSQIQQGSNGSTQSQYLKQFDLDAIRDFVKDLKAALPGIQFNESDRAEAESELQTIEAQLRSTKPKGLILRESLKTLRNLIEGIASNALAASILPMLNDILKSTGL
jgi:hypothetical protein